MNDCRFTPYVLAFLMLISLSGGGCAHRRASSAPPQAAHQLELVQADGQIDGSETSDSAEVDFLEEEFAETQVRVADPLAGWNRMMFWVNDKVYFYGLKPAAEGYQALVPEGIRTGVKNFFYNLRMPVRVVNCLLQGRADDVGGELGRFVLNSTAGVLGFGDPAAGYPDMAGSDEDLGQTLGAYGLGHGIYIVWPFLGPSTLRDSVGMIGDRFASPPSHLRPRATAAGVSIYRVVNDASFRIGDYERLKAAFPEPYSAMRDSYVQLRDNKVSD